VRAKLFRDVFTIEARKLMSYRADFWINTLVGSLVGFGLVYILWSAIFKTPDQVIAGYSFDGMVLYYVLVILLGRLCTGSGAPLDVGQEIYEGSLSRYLLFPAPYIMIKYAQRLGMLLPSFIQLTLLFGAYILLLPLPAEVHFTPQALAMGVISLCLANALYFAMTVLLQLAAFWADNVWSLVVMMVFTARLLGGSMIPLATFPEAWHPLLKALPFRYFFGFPVDTLMGRVSPDQWLTGTAISLVWFCALALMGRWTWSRGMRQYSGVGI
jgi:ABC-2 type transport system permease protein